MIGVKKLKKLKEITRPKYFEQNVVPFLENRPTDFEMPKWISKDNILTGLAKMIKGSSDLRKPNYKKFDSSVGNDWLFNVTKDLEHGDFVYIGSKEEVYLLSFEKEDREVAKPFWFSNNYLGAMNKFDMEKPLFKGNGYYDFTEYRTSNPPSFNKKPFIFTAMGRNQDRKNSVFTGEPDLITADLSEALSHFKKTDFKEFDDVVKNYANKLSEFNY